MALRHVGRLAVVVLVAAGAVMVVASPAGAWSSSDGSYVVFGGGHNGGVIDVQVDASGNIYTCGGLRGSGDVDPNYYDSTEANESAAGKQSSLVTKLDSSGSLVWSSLMDSSGDDWVQDCVLDSSGNVYVTGKFIGSMDFDDDGTAEVTALDDANGGYDAYVAKLNSSGTVVWWKVVGNTTDVSSQLDTVYGYGVGVDSSGNVYFGGHFTGTIDIDPSGTTTAVTATTNANKYDAYLVKLDSSGNTVWTRHWGGSANDYLYDIDVDSSGNVVAVGMHNNGAGDVNYHPIAGGCTSSCGETLVTGYGGWDGSISKIGSDGTLTWAGFVGSAFNDRLLGVTTDDSGNIYGTGYYKAAGTPDFDPGSGSSITLPTNSSGDDAFVIKVGSDGNGVWAKAFETTSGVGVDQGDGIAVDGSGNVYVTGTFDTNDTVDFDPGSGTTAFTADNTDDVFGVKLDSSGSLVWARQFETEGTYSPEGNSVAVDGSGNVYFAGKFYGHMDFDPGSGEAWWLATTAMARQDGFVVKLDSSGDLGNGNSAWVENAPSGWDVVHGPVDGTNLQGWLSEVVRTSPLCSGGKWEFDHISNLGHRLYVIQDSALASSGLGVGDYIWANYSTYSATVPDYNQLWLGSANDHDGNTSMLGQTFKILGWTAGANAGSTVSYYTDSSNVLQWETNGTARAGTVDKGAGAGVVPSGYSVYFALANKNYESRSFADLESISATSCGTPGFSVSESSRTVSESGSTQTFTVVLTGDPSSDVVIDVSSSDTGEATVSASSLTFTSSNWDTAQTITVTGIPDLLDDGDQTTTVTLSVNDGSSDDDFDSLADQTVSVTTTDVDLAPAFTTAITSGCAGSGCSLIGLAEGGNTGTFTVVLDTAPAGNVVFDVTSTDTTEATVSTATLTFTGSNWDTAQTVTVSSVDDDLDDDRQDWDVIVAVNDAASHDAWDSLADGNIDGKTTDDEVSGFTLSGTTASVSENGSTATFTVVLDSEPTGNVVFSLSSADTGEVTVSPAALTFTSSNWDTPQTVTLTGIDDTASDGNQTTNVTVSVNDSSTADSAYDALSDLAVAVTTADDDSAGVTVSASGGATTVSEAGSTDTFTVVLNTQPSSNVVINASSGDTGEATVAPAALTFTSSNWNTPQTMTVTGIDDDSNDGDQTTTITVFVVDGSSDDAYGSVANLTLDATTTDDDSPGLTISTSSVTVTEAGSASTFTVQLNTKPSSNVVVNVSTSDSGEAIASTTALTFTPSNWDIAQTVTVTGVNDIEDDGNQTSTVTLSVNDAGSDDDYDSVTDSTISVTTTDDDDPVVTTTTAQAPMTTAPELGTVSLSAIPACSSVTIHWAPGTTSGLQSFSLASKAPGAGWITHSTHLSTTRSFAIGSLANGLHSFQIQALYDNGTSKVSNVGDVTISDCPVIILPTPTTGPPFAMPVTTTIAPVTTTIAPVTTTIAPVTTTTTTTTTPVTTTVVPPTTTTNGDGGSGSGTTTTTTEAPPPSTTAIPTTEAPPPSTTAIPTTEAPPPSTTAIPTTQAPATTVDDGSGSGSGSTSTVVTTTTEDDEGTVAAPLSRGTDDDDGGLPVGGPITIFAALAALAAAAYFGWIASLGRFLAGSAFGLFMIALWRRRRVPTPPRQVRVQRFDDGDIEVTWSQPRRPKKLDRYSIEGFKDGRWLLLHEHMSTTTHARYPRSAQPVVTQWRVTAINRHGTSSPSGEVEVKVNDGQASGQDPGREEGEA